jgi:plastocyanin domain-containing protein
VALAITVGCGRDTANAPAGASVVRIEVNDSGFVPNRIELAAGEPAVLEFIRTGEASCATAVVFPDTGIRHELPLNKAVRVTVAVTDGQEIAFACPMDMYKGSVRGRAATEQGQVTAKPVNGIVEVRVDQAGFHPDRIQLPVNTESILRFTRTAEKTCNDGVLIPDLGIDQKFPLNQPVDVTITPNTPGEIVFSCPMKMSTGVIEVAGGEPR